MTADIKELRKKLQAINKEYEYDEEVAHSKFDDALLDYIGDKRVTDLYNDMERWCA